MPRRALSYVAVVTTLATVTLLLTLSLVIAAPAGAAERTTPYYTIDHKQRIAASPFYFLTARANDHRKDPKVYLNRYRSGDHSQQWTPVYSEWPNSPSVSGSAGDIFCDVFCPDFQGQGSPSQGTPPPPTQFGDPYPFKLVNRASRKCITVVAFPRDRPPSSGGITQLVQAKCTNQTTVRDRQIWKADYATWARGKGSFYERLHNRSYAGKARCLDTANYQQTPVPLQTLDCRSPAVWHQQFRMLKVDQVTCPVNYPGTVCGLPPTER